MPFPAPHSYRQMPGLCGNVHFDILHIFLARIFSQDSLPEWSKGVDSSSTSESCVGSNPTAAKLRLVNAIVA